jgi:uncharacterized small protein (DUF1192 family)
MEELEQGATAEVEVSQEDAMEKTIAETYAKLSSPQDSPDEPEIQDSPNEGRVRDQSGRFAKKVYTEQSIAEAVEEVPPEAPPQKAAPAAWKKEAQEAFLKADPILQAEIERREADFHRGIEQYKAAAAFGSSIDNALAPFKETLQSLNVTPDAAVSELMRSDAILRFGSQDQKEMHALQMCQYYGIDVKSVLSRLEGTDPRIFEEQRRANYYEQQIQQYQQQAQQQEFGRLNSMIQTFAADPNHSHFNEVRGHMAALLQAGQAQSLEDAYEQAVYANPATRAAALQRKEAEIKAELAKKAQIAKAASSVNMRSRPSLPTERPIGTMEDTIREKLRELGAF